jgi:hypothetical protein
MFDHENVINWKAPLITKEMVSAEGIESTLKRTFNNMQVSG